MNGRKKAKSMSSGRRSKFGEFSGTVAGKPSLAQNVGKIFQPMAKVAETVTGGIEKMTAKVGKSTLRATRKVAAVPESVLKKAFLRSRTSNMLRPSEKTMEELQHLDAALKTCFLFQHLSQVQLDDLAACFEKMKYKANQFIFRQNDPGDYFYILYEGRVVVKVDGEEIGSSDDQDYFWFGEMALLHNNPREVATKTATDSIVFRIDYGTFRHVLEDGSRSYDEATIRLLQQVEGVEELDQITLAKLGRAMTEVIFEKDEIIHSPDLHVGTFPFMVVKAGTISVKDLEMGGMTYEDARIGPGHKNIAIGWQFMTAESSIPGKATIVAATKVTALWIDKETFRDVFGDYAGLARRMSYKNQLCSIAVFKDSQLEDDQIDSLVGMIRQKKFWRRTTLFRIGVRMDPAIFFVRRGTVTLTDEEGEIRLIEKNGYFGDDLMLADHNKETDKPPSIKPRYTAVVSMDSILDFLYLEDCRKVVDTKLLGLGKPTKVSAFDNNIKPEDIKRHVMLGAGSYGQVWLASTPDGRRHHKRKPRIYALKIQSKFHLLEKSQAEGVLAECNILASLKSPFIIRLYRTFQDSKCVYMLTSLLQGGELSDLINDGMGEVDAKFYAAGILEGLTYMHQKHIIHRDVKPENVLINSKGYPVIVDFGFAKYVTDKAYTCCGTPIYCAPEVIKFKGHDKAADYWSWACIVYELVTGDYAFYERGMDQLELIERTERGQLTVYGWMSLEVKMLLISTLVPDPTHRLGSRPSGWFDVLESPWFDDVDFKELRSQSIKAPWVPTLKNPLDAPIYFNDNDHVKDKLTETDPILDEADQQVFKPFGQIIATPKF
eukprot:scaffold442_cov110-Cylindrotheca_fusiformis.AAC.6